MLKRIQGLSERKKDRRRFLCSIERQVGNCSEKIENKLRDRMKKQLLNSVIAKYRDLSMSRRWIIFLSLWHRQIIDLLATDKSRYFAQPRPTIVNCFAARGHCFCCLFYCPLKGFQAIHVRPHESCTMSHSKVVITFWSVQSVFSIRILSFWPKLNILIFQLKILFRMIY